MIRFSHEQNESGGKFILIDNNIPAGEITYVWAGNDKFIIDHTQTYEGSNGKGYGQQLLMKAIKYAQEKEVKIIPLCTYASKVIREDKNYHEMIFK